MEVVARKRRETSASDDSPVLSAKPYTKLSKPGRSVEEGRERGLGWILPLMALGIIRYMSATSNIIHDCDEVFNYWEPLHYLLYHSGFQTWEYSSNFALRSYLYLIFYELVGKPASWFFGEEKVMTFFAVRYFLGLLSVLSDTVMVIAISRKFGKRLASYALAMLCLTSGCFFASTSFLPSSFCMYTMSLSVGFYLLGKPAMAVSVAATGVILGWPFSILAFLPLTLYSLAKRFKQVFFSAMTASVMLIMLSVIIDHHYYGKWTSSILNILVYNILGGGQSHLYGTEGCLYYLKNGFNNFNFGFVFALSFVPILPIMRKKYDPDLVVVVSPIYIWLVFMSLQPHKEERFLYPIYPLVCVAAAAVIESFPEFFYDKYNTNGRSSLLMAAKCLRPVALGLILICSHARTFSLINGYSAPMVIYQHLEHHDDDSGKDVVVCIGSEWHRFPSSFFIPGYVSQVRWIDDGFRGILPHPFNTSLGGTAAAPPHFNNKNMASVDQYVGDMEECSFLVELKLNRRHDYRGNNLSTWEAVAAWPFLDRELSPPLYRSFFIPYLWQQKNVFGIYRLLKRLRP